MRIQSPLFLIGLVALCLSFPACTRDYSRAFETSMASPVAVPAPAGKPTLEVSYEPAR